MTPLKAHPKERKGCSPDVKLIGPFETFENVSHVELIIPSHELASGCYCKIPSPGTKKK